MNIEKGNRSRLQIREAMKKQSTFYDATEKRMLNKWYPETKFFSEAQRQDIFQLFGIQLSLAEIDVLRQSFPSRNFAEIKSMFQNQEKEESAKWIEQLLKQRKFNSGNKPGVEKISKPNCDSAWTIINAFQTNLSASQPKKVVENITDCINKTKSKPDNAAIIQTTKLDETHKPHSYSFFADAMTDMENSEKTEIDFQIPSATVQVKNKKNNQVRNIALNPFETTLMFNKVRSLSNELNENIHELVIDFLYRNPDLIEDESIRKNVIDCREKHDKYLNNFQDCLEFEINNDSRELLTEQHKNIQGIKKEASMLIGKYICDLKNKIDEQDWNDERDTDNLPKTEESMSSNKKKYQKIRKEAKNYYFNKRIKNLLYKFFKEDGHSILKSGKLNDFEFDLRFFQKKNIGMDKKNAEIAGSSDKLAKYIDQSVIESKVNTGSTLEPINENFIIDRADPGSLVKAYKKANEFPDAKKQINGGYKLAQDMARLRKNPEIPWPSEFADRYVKWAVEKSSFIYEHRSGLEYLHRHPDGNYLQNISKVLSLGSGPHEELRVYADYVKNNPSLTLPQIYSLDLSESMLSSSREQMRENGLDIFDKGIDLPNTNAQNFDLSEKDFDMIECSSWDDIAQFSKDTHGNKNEEEVVKKMWYKSLQHLKNGGIIRFYSYKRYNQQFIDVLTNDLDMKILEYNIDEKYSNHKDQQKRIDKPRVWFKGIKTRDVSLAEYEQKMSHVKIYDDNNLHDIFYKEITKLFAKEDLENLKYLELSIVIYRTECQKRGLEKEANELSNLLNAINDFRQDWKQQKKRKDKKAEQVKIQIYLEAIKNIELHVQSDSLSLDQIKVMLTELVGYLDLKSCQKLYQKCLENSKLAVLLPEIMSLIENSVDRIQLVYDARIWPLVKGNNELRKKVWQMMLKFPELFLADVLFSSNIDEEIKKAYIQNIDWLNNNTVELVNKFLAEKTDEKNMTKYARIIMNNAPKNININIPNKLLKGDLLDIFSKRIYNQQVLKMTNSEDLPDDLKNYFIKMINIFENEKPSSDSVDNFVTSFGLLVENLENSNKLKAYKFVEKYFFQDSGYLDEIQNKIHKIEMEIMIKKYNDFKINHLEKSNNVIDREVVTDEFNKLMSDDSELIDFLAGRYLSYQENNLDDPTTAKIDEFDNVILELILEKYPSDYRKIMFLARKITRSTSDKNWKVKAQFDIVEINNLMINNMDLLLHKETTNILIGQEILSIKNLAQVVDWVGENFEKISMISNCDNKTATKILQNTLRDFDQQKFLHFISAFPKAVHNSTILRKAMNYNNQAIDVAILLDIHSTDDILYLADQGEKGLTLALFLVIHKQENSLRSNIFAQLFKKHYNKHTRSFFMRVAANNPSLQIYPESFSCLTDFCPKDLFYIALKNKLVLNLKDYDIEKIGKNNYYLKRPEEGKRVVKIFNGEDSFCKIKSEDKKYYELQVILKNSSDIGVNLLDKRKLINTTVDICNNDCYLTLDEHGTVCGLEARDNNKRLGFIHRDDFPEKFLDDIRSKGYIASLNAIKLRYEKLDNDGNWIFKVTK